MPFTTEHEGQQEYWRRQDPLTVFVGRRDNLFEGQVKHRNHIDTTNNDSPCDVYYPSPFRQASNNLHNSLDKTETCIRLYVEKYPMLD